MPKVIKNLEETVYNNASTLFFEKGYEGVDMKAIAKKCNIAVGTLYNYYANKEELFIYILKKSWQNTFEKLYELKYSNIEIRKKVKNIVEILYKDIKDRKGMGIQIQNINGFNEEEIKKVQDEIIMNLKALVEPVPKIEFFNEDKGIDIKLIYSLLANIMIGINEFPEEDENNINYINHMLIGYLKL